MKHNNRAFQLALASALLWIGLLTQPSVATTVSVVDLTCPIDGTVFQALQMTSNFIPGVSRDFRPEGTGVTSYLGSLTTCPTCGFSASAGMFDETEGLDVEQARKALAAFESSVYFRTIDAAALVETHWGNNVVTLAHYALGAKWMADDTGEPEVIRQRTDAAIVAHQRLIDQHEGDDTEIAGVIYLMGELSRQIGRTEEADRWLRRASRVKTENLDRFIQNQLHLNALDASDPHALIDGLADATDIHRVAAIPLLRDIDDPVVIAFIRKVVLECDDDLREEAIDHLFVASETTGGERGPRAFHRDIFVEALSNDHFRVVQSGAYGVEKLKITEAAPQLIRIIQEISPSRDKPFARALEVVATEAEVDFLIESLTQKKNRLLLRALLHTRSKRAIPFLLEVLPDYVEELTYDEDAQERIGSFPALIEALPDIRVDSGQWKLAVAKALGMGYVDTEASRKELRGALEWDDTLSRYAAISLARRGDPSGKATLLKDHEWLASYSYSRRLLYPLLEPNDYALVKVAVDSIREERKQKIRDRGKEVNDQTFNEDDFINNLLQLLAATNHLEVEKVLLRLLDSYDRSTARNAMHALKWMYNARVGQVLVERLIENPDDRWRVVEYLGKSGDVSHVPLLMELIEEPTSVYFKLIWLEAMQTLASEHILPVAEKWARSPHPKLASASRQSIAQNK